MIYLFHGEEEFLRSEELQKVQAAIEPADMVSLNTTRLDGSKTTFAELKHACDTVPFLSSRRLVVVDSLIAHLTKPPKNRKKGDEESADGDEQQEGNESSQEEEQELSAAKKTYLQDLADYLPLVPTSTDLVFLEAKSLTTKRKLMKVVSDLSAQNRARIVRCDNKSMKWRERQAWIRQWIVDAARAKGSSIAPDATEELLELVDDDLRLLDQEIEKLVSYCLGRRIAFSDVRLLATRAKGPDIFKLVDNLGLRRGDLAMAELHRLVQDPNEALAVLGMISRQYRSLLQIKDLMARGACPGDMEKELQIRDWQVRKLQDQARLYTMPQLEAIYTKLRDTDLSIKTGRAEPDMALVLLVADLTG
jgi:DNA polymerase-3 subunit delta